MSRLSRVFSNKRKKQSPTKSLLISRMTSYGTIKKVEDEMLLGNLFIMVDDNNIIDLNNNYSVDVCRAKVDNSLTHKHASKSISFNGCDSNINIKDQDHIELGIEDFSLDWWECPKPLPVPNYDFMPALQCVMYKNSIDRKHPIILQNDGITKRIFLSSDGDHWDIADGKYMGDAPKNEWVHWAFIRCNNNFYTFRNGKVTNIWRSNKVINASDEYFTIGSGPKGSYFYGYMHKIRFTKGQALWTEEFNIEEDLFY